MLAAMVVAVYPVLEDSTLVMLTTFGQPPYSHDRLTQNV